MRGDAEEFQVDSFHRVLTQVELPGWLPLNVVEEITARFEQILRNQIITMMIRQKKKHAHHPSNQSEGGFSSDEDDEFLASVDKDPDGSHSWTRNSK